MKNKYLFAALLSVFLLLSCKNEKKVTLVDLSAVENLALSVEWAVISDPYAAYRIKPQEETNITAHGRRGDVLPVVGKSLTKNGIWYQFAEGWLPHSAVQIYSNKLKAESVANSIK
jgi:hypothetical protein